jgi:serine-type D-Ala-D-Ala carboxypeptidase/endopeptidase (penicillin-binding protein 4)
MIFRYTGIIALNFALLGGCATAVSVPPTVETGAISLTSEIDALLDDPDLAHAYWGILIKSLETGETIYDRNADRLFVPASNMKIITGAAALETLGPEFRFRTTVAAGGPIQNGVVDGPLVVTGTGDPSFGSRFADDSRAVFRAWADSLRLRGITRVAGGVIGVDTAFTDPTLGQGWMWDDLAGNSSAEFGALQFNYGVIDLEIFPAQTVLQPAVILVDPPTQFVRITNDTRTMPAGTTTAIRVSRDEAGQGIVVRGEVAADATPLTRTVAIRNPALYVASLVRETLREEGIAVEGPAIHYTEIGLAHGSLQHPQPLFSYDSPPLSEILTAMMKPSQNQIAETLLRTVARELGGEGTASRAAIVVDSLFQAWELENIRMRLADGSGLSRYDLVSPALLVEILTHMDASPHREVWITSLPIAGRDGTLASRMEDPPLLDQVHAKTGSLSGIRALSGYLTTRSGERIVFSTVANNYYGVPTSEVDAIVEGILARVAETR